MSYKVLFYIILILALFFIPIKEVKSNAFLLENNELKELDKEDLLFTGTIKDLRYHIWSRDNFYTFKVQDHLSERYIEVKLYTVKWLKRMNHFNCAEDDEIVIRHLFHFKANGQKVGNFNIVREVIFLDCFQISLEKRNKKGSEKLP